MERLTKSERVGLVAFAVAIACFLIVAAFLGKNGGSVQQLSDADSLKIIEFKAQIDAMESDTVVKNKPKVPKRKKQTAAPDINPFDDKLPKYE